MPRPRLNSDAEILDQVIGFLARQHTPHWTLADVAATIDLHPTTLVKRFGSKGELLTAATRRWLASIPIAPTSPDDAVTELARFLTRDSHGSASHGVTRAAVITLMGDLDDPQRQPLIREGWKREHHYVVQLLTAARERGQFTRLPQPDEAAAILLDAVRGHALTLAAGIDTNHHSPSLLLEGWS